MRIVEERSDPRGDGRLMSVACDQGMSRPCASAPTQSGGISPCVSHGGYSGGEARPFGMTPQERIVDAVVGVVTAVIDVVVAVLERAKGDRTPASQNPQPHPIVPSKPVGRPSEGTPTSTTPSGNTPAVGGRTLQAIQDDTGAITVRTADGYSVKAEGDKRGWSIISPQGRTTQISPDQEARESDGGHWRFQGRSSFVFGSNKVTFESKTQTKGVSKSSGITVYSGADRVTIGGLNTARPSILALSSDGRQHDDGLSDGTSFYRADTIRGESWSRVENGKRRVMGA